MRVKGGTERKAKNEMQSEKQAHSLEGRLCARQTAEMLEKQSE